MSVRPYRDDIAFLVSDIDIRKYGSQGQQRTAALSLKLSEIELVKQSIHDTPVYCLTMCCLNLINTGKTIY